MRFALSLEIEERGSASNSEIFVTNVCRRIKVGVPGLDKALVIKEEEEDQGVFKKRESMANKLFDQSNSQITIENAVERT